MTFGAGGKDKDGVVTAGWGYYETVAGGSGAGPGWHGTSGVHTHITNTRIGDVELLERRYPVLVREFSIREGSGGAGKYKGGCGVTREMEFLQPIQVSILSEVGHNMGIVGPRGRQTVLMVGIFLSVEADVPTVWSSWWWAW